MQEVSNIFFLINYNNASFTSLNVAKVTMKEMGMEYSMSSFKSLMTNIYLVKRIFKASGYTPNRTLISKIFKDLSCLQRIAALHIIELLTNYCFKDLRLFLDY